VSTLGKHMVSVQGFPSGEDRSFNVVKLRIISDKNELILLI